jgi:hypothetical protein
MKKIRFILANTEQLHDKIFQLSDRVRQLEDALESLQASCSNQPHLLLAPELRSIKTSQDLYTSNSLQGGPATDKVGPDGNQRDEASPRFVFAVLSQMVCWLMRQSLSVARSGPKLIRMTLLGPIRRRQRYHGTFSNLVPRFRFPGLWISRFGSEYEMRYLPGLRHKRPAKKPGATLFGSKSLSRCESELTHFFLTHFVLCKVQS